MAFNLLIITPKGTYLEDRVDSLTLKMVGGYRTILTNHYPLIGLVDVAPAYTKKGNNVIHYSLNGGLLNVTKDKVVVIANSIESQKEIDVERAKSAKVRAEERLKSKDENIDLKRANTALLRAISRIKTSSK